MLPDIPPTGVLHVTRAVDAHPDDVAEAIADFVYGQDLEADRSDHGEGTLFRPRPDPQTSGPWFFGKNDSLRVIVIPHDDDIEVQFVADLRGMHRRGDSWKQGQYIRGALVTGFLLSLGVAGLTNGVDFGDFVLLGAGALMGRRSVARARGEADSREEIERNLANALERVCDEMDR